jgi:hypothetical protein
MRGLGAFGLADLKRAVFYHVAVTVCLKVGDPSKFNMGTPAEVLETLERYWAIALSGPRIVEDIAALVRMLEKIVENESACLLDEFYRSGRREVSCSALARDVKALAGGTGSVLGGYLRLMMCMVSPRVRALESKVFRKGDRATFSIDSS